MLRLRNYRNYEALDLSLAEGLNLLVGANAQGKTNVLEALYLASSTRLLRGLHDSEAIREGSDEAEVSADLSALNTTITIRLVRGQRKRALLNGLGLPRAADVIGRLPSVCLSSHDLPVVQGGASERRMFLDIEISQIYPAYMKKLATYKRALDHRNSLLKVRPLPHPSSFEPWEAALAESGSEVRAYRRRFIEDLSPVASMTHSRMGEGEDLSLSSSPRDPAQTPDEFVERLEQTRREDSERGATSVGPHRDEMSILISGHEARLFGSQGQQRTAVISLKLGVHTLARERLGEAPLLLLDDMLSDLDATRRSRLVEWVIQESGQAVLTCTEISAVGRELAERARTYKVTAGQVEQI